jgi:hypothetical protein
MSKPHRWCCTCLFMLFSNLAFAANINICTTHESCAVNQTCSCTVAADAYNYRYYYFDISGFIQGQHYQCRLQGSPPMMRIDLTGSKFPAGSEYICQGDCPRFPLTLLIDTTKMVKSLDVASFRYGVSPSDSPYQVNISCQASSS